MVIKSETFLAITKRRDQIFSSDEYLETIDPFGYDDNPEDQKRKSIFLNYLPVMNFKRVIDIGVGTGFITRDLPFAEFVGIDISETAVNNLNNYFIENDKSETHKGIVMSLLEPGIESLGTFDLIILTGVLYPHYLGENRVIVNENIKKISRKSCTVISVHIKEWEPFRLDENFVEIDRWFYPYRNFTHELIVTRKTS